MVPQFGFTTMLDTMELMRKTWDQLNLPAAFAPTMDLEELDRRIKELKTVEQWLSVNMNMLRSTIQAMEVQRGTVAALNAFGSALRTPAAADTPRAKPERAPADPGPARRTAEPGATQPAGPDTSSGQGLRPEDADIDAARARGAAGAAPGTQPGAAPGSSQASPPPPEMAMLDPTAWWNLLQQQFQQVAGSALANMPGGTPANPDDAHVGASARSGKRRGTPRSQGEAAAADSSKTAARTPRRAGR